MNLYNQALKKLPRGMTYLDQLTTIGQRMFGDRYVGTFPSDKIPRLKHNQSCILNVDRSTEPGSHWVALYRGKGDTCYVYDSFGRSGITLIPALLDWSTPGRVIDADRDAEQEEHETDCGGRCIAFLYVVYVKGIRKALTI